MVTAHWPDDFKTIVLQSARSPQQLLDSITVLDFERHSPAFKQYGLGFDMFTFMPVCEELLEVFGDIDSAVWVLEKQRLFAEKYYETGGWIVETAGTMLSGGIARHLGMAEGLWAHFGRLDLADEDAMLDNKAVSTLAEGRTKDFSIMYKWAERQSLDRWRY